VHGSDGGGGGGGRMRLVNTVGSRINTYASPAAAGPRGLRVGGFRLR
jgi:hypothetical protein